MKKVQAAMKLVTKESVKEAGKFAGKQLVATILIGTAARLIYGAGQWLKKKEDAENGEVTKKLRFVTSEVKDAIDEEE